MTCHAPVGRTRIADAQRGQPRTTDSDQSCVASAGAPFRGRARAELRVWRYRCRCWGASRRLHSDGSKSVWGGVCGFRIQRMGEPQRPSVHESRDRRKNKFSCRARCWCWSGRRQYLRSGADRNGDGFCSGPPRDRIDHRRLGLSSRRGPVRGTSCSSRIK